MIVGRLARVLAGTVALIGAPFLVPLTVIAIAAAAMQPALGSAFYRDLLASQHVYERLPELAGAQLTRQIAFVPEGAEAPDPSDSGGPPPALRNLTAAQWERVLATLLPAAWLRTQAEYALDQVFADPPQDGPILISLVELKENLARGAAIDAYVSVVEAQPPCDAEGISAWTELEIDLPPCRPPEAVLASVRPLIAATLDSVAGQLPDTVDLRQSFGANPESALEDEPSVNGPSVDLQTARTMSRAAIGAPFVYAAIVGLIALAAGFSWRGIARLAGMPMLVAGTIAAAFVLAGEATAVGVTDAALARAPTYWSPTVTATMGGVAFETIARLSTVFLIAAAAATILSFVLIAVSLLPARVLKRRLARA